MLRSCMGRLSVLICLVLVPLVYADETDPGTDVSFKAQVDGTEQRYILKLPAGFKMDERHDILIALHGHGSDRWQFAKHQLAEGQAARNIAAKYSMLYVSPDYRAKTSWMGPKAEADVVQIIGDLKQRYRIGRVFICGGSMGGTSALTFAALHPELIDGVAAMNGTANVMEYGNFQDAFQESYGGTKKAVPEEYKKRSSEYWPERLVMPVAMATGGKDTLVPPDSCLRLGKVLKLLERDVLILHREQGGHSTNLEDSTAILEFVVQKAKPAAPQKD